LKYNHFMPGQEWRTKFDDEISRGQAARAGGNEGRARVCARRAAAIALREYLESSGSDTSGMDAFRLLNRVRDQPGLPAEVRETLDHLVTRVEPGGAFPIPADLLADAQMLANQLFPTG
jgi:hypothetical protein